MKNKTKMYKKQIFKTTKDVTNVDPILFNTKMRKVFVEGIIQDIKGYFENATDGKVVVAYEDYNLNNREFGFKLCVEKTSKCSKQMWSEATSAIVNVINYMFPVNALNNNEEYSFDVAICTNDALLEVEVVSCW